MSDSYFKVLIKYLLQHKKALACFFAFVSIALVVLCLYQIPGEPILYTGVICSVAGVVFILIDSWHYYRKHQELDFMKSQVMLSLEQLPSAQNLIEEDYQQLLSLLEEHKNAMVSASDAQYRNMMDYYTMWVHQIKTPIAAMRLLLQSEDTSLNYELENELFKIEQYVEMVLSYLRVNASSTDYVFAHHNLEDLVKQSVRKYARMFILKKLTLNLGDCSCDVLTDEKWCCFVLEQLLSNAIKYTPSGFVSIYLEREGVLIIEDSGIGIEESDLHRLFESGFTGYNGHHDKKSSGLGLYLCKKICENLGHTISITSAVGKGSQVRIDFTTVKLEIE